MTGLNIEAIRAEVRALDYVRGTLTDAAMWREDDEDSRANLAIEGMAREGRGLLSTARAQRWRRCCNRRIGRCD